MFTPGDDGPVRYLRPIFILRLKSLGRTERESLTPKIPAPRTDCRREGRQLHPKAEEHLDNPLGSLIDPLG